MTCDDGEWSPELTHVCDVGAEVLGLREEDGVLIVTTVKGTFPIDPRFFDDHQEKPCPCWPGDRR